MELDFRDGVTIVAASLGMLLGALIGIALEFEPLVIWMFGGLISGSGLCSYLFYIDAESSGR